MSREIPAPRRLEKYEVVEEIGRGGMAVVYRARDLTLRRDVALKVMHPHLSGSAQARARFAREALSVARLRHPGIIAIYDYSGEDSEQSYIATELLTGPTLRQFAEQHPEIPSEVAACFGIAVARALSAAHRAQVVHRDVKPENVLIHDRRLVKLSDFGIAQLADAQTMTSTGQVLGSPGHLAPEQLEGRDCDARSDIFSLGTVLYLLATGKLPFRGRNTPQILKRIAEGRYTDPLQVRASIGAPMRDILVRCLQLDPGARYQSAVQLEQDLRAFVEAVGISEPAQLLSDYLGDPVAVAQRLRESTIAKLAKLGEQAQDQGRIPEAMDHFNRVLALDEGNAQVLQSLQRLGRDRRRRLALRATALVAGGCVLALAFYLIAGQWRRDRGVAEAATVTLPSSRVEDPLRRDAGSKQQVTASRSPHTPGFVRDGAAVKPTAGPVIAQPGAPRGASSAPPVRPPETAVAASEPRGASRSRPRAKASRRRAGASDTPRTIVFQPVPANVSIAVDDAPAKPFGPSFNQIELPPGEHEFAFIADHECCFDQRFRLRIPPGPGVTTVRKRLALRPAGLYVVCNVPANVRVDDSKTSGRSRSVLSIPLEHDRTEVHQITVTASGYRDYTRKVQLRAGRVETVKCSLEPASTAPQQTP
ncbi:MAG: protein kinase [Proteobacteria bacterium]|nr:protein kinase [Pseudomonadota bacterium]